MHLYRRRSLTILLCLLFLFYAIGLFAYIQLKRGVGLLSIGLDPIEENLIIIGFSFFSMIKVVYEIYTVETHGEYEKRVRVYND